MYNYNNYQRYLKLKYGWSVRPGQIVDIYV